MIKAYYAHNIILSYFYTFLLTKLILVGDWGFTPY